MNSIFIFSLILLISGSTCDQVHEISNEISLLLEAINLKDDVVVGAMFEMVEDDDNNMDKFIETFQGVNIHLDSAKKVEDGNIEAKIQISDKIPATLVFKKSIRSPYGLRISGISTEKDGQMCTVGILKCAMEILGNKE
ncbi:unnamed protein product [Caenorhabditis nigoni]